MLALLLHSNRSVLVQEALHKFGSASCPFDSHSISQRSVTFFTFRPTYCSSAHLGLIEENTKWMQNKGRKKCSSESGTRFVVCTFLLYWNTFHLSHIVSSCVGKGPLICVSLPICVRLYFYSGFQLPLPWPLSLTSVFGYICLFCSDCSCTTTKLICIYIVSATLKIVSRGFAGPARA